MITVEAGGAFSVMCLSISTSLISKGKIISLNQQPNHSQTAGDHNLNFKRFHFPRGAPVQRGPSLESSKLA